jgi:hypothetical protein
MQQKSGTKLKCAIVVLLLLVGAFLIVPSGTAAAAQEGPFVYEVGGTPAVATITDYIGPGGAVVIPSTLGGYPTAIIDDDAFSWATSMTSVVIPNSTVSLGYTSFYRCTSMASVTIGTGVTTIAYGAFYACSSLTSITFLGLTAPNSVGGDWIAYTPDGIRGHAYAASNFPPPGGNYSGLIMGSVVPAPPSIPGAPVNLRATTGVGFILLNWTAPINLGNPSLTRYDVYRGTSSGIYLGPIGSSPAGVLFYNDSSATPGTQYFYILWAINSVGPSPPSNQAIGTASAPPTAPSAPLNLAASAGAGYARLTWEPPASSGNSAITNYCVYRGASSGGETLLATIGNVMMFNDSGLNNGQTYWYQVSAVNGWGEGARSGEASARPETVPTAPRDLRAVGLNLEVDLKWSTPQYVGPGTLTYHLFRDASPIWNGTALSFRDLVVNKGITYSYRVAASNDIGWGENSSAVVYTVQGVPDAPRGLSATPGDGWVELNWTVPDYVGPGILIYHLFRDGLEVWSGRATGYADTSVVNGITYAYNVTASNSIGWGDSTPEVHATPQLGDTVPSRPQGLTATPGDMLVDLNWTSPAYMGPGDIKYHLFRDGAEIWSGAGTWHNDTSLTGGVIYVYSVSASNSLGWGSNSTPIQVSPFGPPTMTLGLMANPGSGNVTLNWSPPSYVGTGLLYHVFRDSGSAPVWSGPELTWIDEGLSKGLIHHYQVAASNDFGWGPNSSEISATPLGPPDRPTGMHAVSGIQQILLNWTVPAYVGPGTIIYHLFRDDALIWSGTEITHSDDGLATERNYTYKVAASNSVGWSPNSSVSMTAPLFPRTPDAPTGFQVTAGDASATISWGLPASSGSSPLTGYKVYRGNNSSALVLLTTVASGNSYKDTGVSNGQKYYYQVCALNSVGDGQATEVLNATPRAQIVPPVPDNNAVLLVGLGVLVIGFAAAILFLRKRR